MKHDAKIIVALDFSDESSVLEFVGRVRPEQCRLKVGKELFTSFGPALVEKLVDAGFDVFLDLKYHDIPNTVAKACAAAAKLGVWMVNVHATGGRRMMESAREAIDAANHQPLLIGVTVLTSMGPDDLAEIGMLGDPEDNVLRLASLAKASGLDGVVCSAKEVQSLRRNMGDDFLLVTPGIRPQGVDQGDQRRVVTPAEAMEMGSSYLVIGRPITQADDPTGTLLTIESDISPYTN